MIWTSYKVVPYLQLDVTAASLVVPVPLVIVEDSTDLAQQIARRVEWASCDAPRRRCAGIKSPTAN